MGTGATAAAAPSCSAWRRVKVTPRTLTQTEAQGNLLGGKTPLGGMPDRSLRRLILVPALFPLAVSLIRLTGELRNWSPALFNREAGGGGALIGIVWLIPVFGILFGLRRAREGQAPASVGKALGWAALAFALNTALGLGAFALVPSPVA